MRAIWKGAVSFGLVNVPVRLYAATENHDVQFRQVHRTDGGRIKYQRVCSIDGEQVSFDDIAKGYETPDGDMVILTDEDFDVVRVTLVLVVLELLMRPVLRLLAGRGSFLLALLLGIGGQLTVTALALALTLGSAWRTGARSPSSPARRRSSSRSGDGWSVPATRHMSSGTPPNCGGATTT